MTTSISSINAGSTSASESTVKKSTLSDSTKEKLEALGITDTDGMSESQAQAIIASAQQQNTGEDSQQQSNSSESEILSEAKSLAASMGISVSDDSDVSEILNDIGNELEVMLEEAENNPSILPALSTYLSTLTSLDDRYDSLQSSQENMFSAMNMVSTNNKIALGLN